MRYRHIRKLGAFLGGQLGAGEIGVNTSAGQLSFSHDGTTVRDVPQLGTTPGVVIHGADAAVARPTGHPMIFWVGSVQPTNAQVNDVLIIA